MRQAGVMLIIKDGLILAISRRHDKTIFGLPGGKYDAEVDTSVADTATRECLEETGITARKCTLVYQRIEVGDGANPVDFESATYYAEDWDGSPHNTEEGNVEWLTAKELTSTKAAFGDYNRQMLNEFKKLFPDVKLLGE